MKKIVSIILASIMVLSFAACGAEKNGATAEAVLPDAQFDTLNKIIDGGFGTVGSSTYDNLYIQNVVNKFGTEFVVIVKVLPEQLDAFNSVDFFAENSAEQYLAVVGDNEITNVMNTEDYLPDKQTLDSYKGMTIAEFEAQGAWMSGYAGVGGAYSFDFCGDVCDYRVELEKGTKLEDYEEIEQFDAAVQDKKIGSVECTGLGSTFIDAYLEQFLDAPALVIPLNMGVSMASLDEINEAVGSDIKAFSGATGEVFSVISGRIAQYICAVNGTYCCVRAAADTSIDLTDDSFSANPIVDEEGYVTLSSRQTDAFNSIRFVFNDYQYAYMIYDNGEFDWSQVDAMQSSYRNHICEYPDSSVFAGLQSSYTADGNYSMSIIPVSFESAQVSVFTYNETEQMLWTMMVKNSGNGLKYGKCRLEIYKDGNSTAQEYGNGNILIQDGSLIWDGLTFEPAE